jgi:hypothetical protein
MGMEHEREERKGVEGRGEERGRQKKEELKYVVRFEKDNVESEMKMKTERKMRMA